MKRYLLPMVFMLALSGCDLTPWLDASNEQTFSFSDKKIVDVFSKEKKEELLRKVEEVDDMDTWQQGADTRRLLVGCI